MEKQLQGTGTHEIIYEIPFSKEAVKELYDQRESDKTIQFMVKDEETGKAIQVRDVTGNTQKSYELFRDSEFDSLFKGEYIPAATKEEMRMEALAQNLIGGTTADYQPTKQPATSNSKNLYK